MGAGRHLGPVIDSLHDNRSLSTTSPPNVIIRLMGQPLLRSLGRDVARLASVVLLFAGFIYGQAPRPDRPNFRDYPVGKVFGGPTTPPHIGSLSQYSGTDLRCFGADPSFFREMHVNFAGHYVLDACTCGSGCHYLYLWDAVTRRLYRDLPLGEINLGPYGTFPHLTTFRGERYHAESTLLIVNGCREETCDCGTWYFNWESEHFSLIRKRPSRRPPGCGN